MKTVSLARDRDWWRWSTAVGLVRMPPAMAALALAFAGVHVTGSYATGAALGASFALGEAVSAPWRGRALDRCPPERRIAVMTWALIGAVGVLLALAFAVWMKLPVAVLFVLAILAAVLPAGLPGGYRAMLTAMMDPVRSKVAFSWDAAILEVEWFMAPLLVSLVLLTGQPALAPVVMALCALGGLLVTRRLAVFSEAAPAESSTVDGSHRAWKSPAAWPTYLTSVLLGVAEGGLIAVLPALLVALSASSTMAGVFAAVLSAGSFLGGVLLAVFAQRLKGDAGVHADIALVLMGLLALPAVAVSSVPWLAIPFLAGGLFIAPVNALRSQALENALPLKSRSEGFSIQYGAHGLGVASGSLLVALLVTSSAQAALAAVLVVPVVLAGGSILLRLVAERRRVPVG